VLLTLKRKFIFTLLFLLFSFVTVYPAYGKQAIPDTEDSKAPDISDSLQTYPAKLDSKQPWEKVASLPGKLLFSPVKITFEGIAETAAYIDKTSLIPKAINFFTHDIRPFILSPNYSSRHGAGIKVGYTGIFNEESDLSFTVSYGLRERHRYRVRFQKLHPFGPTLSTNIIVQQRFYSDEKFFGIGNESQFSNKSNYGLKQFTIETSTYASLREKTAFNAQFGMDINTVHEGRNTTLSSVTDLYCEDNLPGLEKEIRIMRMQFGISHDSRNRMRRTTGGGIVTFGGGLFNDIGNKEFSFWKTSVSFTRYIHLFYNRTLIFRAAGEITEPFSGQKVPFYYLSKLGAQETIRGFDRGRFRDQDMMLFSIEYRYPIWEKLDAGLFLDGGRVSNNIFNDFSSKDFNVGYGGTLNIWGKESLITQLAVGISKDRIRLYFSLNTGL